jgi:hypothetical protein
MNLKGYGRMSRGLILNTLPAFIGTPEENHKNPHSR